MGKIVSGILGTDKAKAAGTASAQQMAAAQQGINAVQDNFSYIKSLLTPFTSAGTGALDSQQDLLGLNGQDAQQLSIDAIQNSPIFQTLKDQGETSILQNASATGGLRGGNTEVALSQFSPNLLNQLIQQQYSNLGGISQLGLGAGTSLANAGTGTASAVANLFQQSGAAQAGGTIAQGNQSSNAISNIAGLAGIYGALKPNNNSGSSSLGNIASVAGLAASFGF